MRGLAFSRRPPPTPPPPTISEPLPATVGFHFLSYGALPGNGKGAWRGDGVTRGTRGAARAPPRIWVRRWPLRALHADPGIYGALQQGTIALSEAPSREHVCEPGGCWARQDKAGALKIRMRSSQASFPPRNLPLRLGSCLDLPLSAPARLTAAPAAPGARECSPSPKRPADVL